MGSIITIGVNLETLALLIILLLTMYLIGLIIAASYVYFTPKSLSSFLMVVFLIGWTIPWAIMGNSVMLSLSFLFTIFLLIYTIYKVRKKRKAKKSSGNTNPLNRSDSS
jgi:hypothetical protein